MRNVHAYRQGIVEGVLRVTKWYLLRTLVRQSIITNFTPSATTMTVRLTPESRK